MNNNLVKFIEKVTKLLSALEISDTNGITKSLTTSFFINSSRILMTSEENSKYIKDFSSASDSNPEKLLEYLDSKQVDYQEILVNAQKETLQSFVDELRNTITPEKVEELNKIISE